MTARSAADAAADVASTFRLTGRRDAAAAADAALVRATLAYEQQSATGADLDEAMRQVQHLRAALASLTGEVSELDVRSAHAKAERDLGADLDGRLAEWEKMEANARLNLASVREDARRPLERFATAVYGSPRPALDAQLEQARTHVHAMQTAVAVARARVDASSRRAASVDSRVAALKGAADPRALSMPGAAAARNLGVGTARSAADGV